MTRKDAINLRKKMSFLGKKNKYKFKVDFQLQELTAVPYANSIVFAKLRLLDGGSFQGFSEERPVRSNVVAWNEDFSFHCKMTASAATCLLDECKCRVSIRTLMKGSREKIKLGFCDVNLAEYASGIQDPQAYLLQPYNPSQRLSNIILHVRVALSLQSENPLFKAPPRMPVIAAIASPASGVVAIDSTDSENDAAAASVAGMIGGATSSLQRLLQQQPSQSPSQQRISSASSSSVDERAGLSSLLDPRVSAFPGGEVVMVFDAPDAMAPASPSSSQQQQLDHLLEEDHHLPCTAKHYHHHPSSSTPSLSSTTIASGSLASTSPTNHPHHHHPPHHNSCCLHPSASPGVHPGTTTTSPSSRSPTLSKFLDFVSFSSSSASSPSSPVVPRQNSDEGRQQQQKHSHQLQKQLSSQIASRLSLNASAACVEDSSTSSPTTASSAALASEEENQFYDVCSDSDVTSYSDVIKGDKSHAGDSISHSRNPSNISAGSGYYSLNTASHSRQSSYNNTAEILQHQQPQANAATGGHGGSVNSSTTTPSIYLQHHSQHKTRRHRRQRSDGGVSTTSDPSADEGVGDRSSTTSFNSLKRVDGRESTVAAAAASPTTTVTMALLEDSSQMGYQTTPVPSKRDRSRFKKLTPDPPSIPSSSGANGSGANLCSSQHKSGSHSLLGSAGGGSGAAAAVADSSFLLTDSSQKLHPHHHLCLGLSPMSGSSSSALTLTTSPLSSSLHGSQRLAETRVSSDDVIDDLFLDATGEGFG